MGMIFMFGMVSNMFDGVDRYFFMGIDEGSRLWEKMVVVL